MIDGTDLAGLVRMALREDLASPGDPRGDLLDVTARVSVAEDRAVRARIVAKAAGVVAGVAAATACFRQLDAAVAVEVVADDGAAVRPGDPIMRLAGRAGALLAAERTALNLLQRLSGVATRTAEFVAAVAGTGARIYDTRKTTPLWRAEERAAVRAGGGCNHRFNLADQVLLKENHFALAGCGYQEVVRGAVARAAELGLAVPVIAEARDVAEARAAVHGGAGVVLLDNFAPGPELAAAVAAVREEARARGVAVAVEASGGVRLDNVRAFAECGVDRISVGALTHSAPALDLSLLMTAEASA